jgi:copper(I)-binding protein
MAISSFAPIVEGSRTMPALLFPRRLLCVALAAITLSLPLVALPQSATISVERAVSPPSPGAAPTGAVYLSLENRGKTPDRLVSASSPRAKRVGLHTMTMTGDVMRMREVEGIDLKAGEKLAMSPGSGYHVMLEDLTAPLRNGESFPLALRFEKAGTVNVQVQVMPVAAGGHGH